MGANKIDIYLGQAFLRALAMVLGLSALVVSAAAFSQDIVKDGMTGLETAMALAELFITTTHFLLPFYISIAASLVIIKLGSTSQFVVMLVSKVSNIRILKAPIAISGIIGLSYILLSQPLENYLKNKNYQIKKNLLVRNKKILPVTIKDISKTKDTIVINGLYKYGDPAEMMAITDAVLLVQKNDHAAEATKAKKVVLTSKGTWVLYDALVLNGDTKTLLRKNVLTTKGSISRRAFLEQIDYSAISNIANNKTHDTYELIGYVSGRKKIISESESFIKKLFWTILTMPLKLICAILIVPILISHKAVTRRGLKISAILGPPCVIGVYTAIITSIAAHSLPMSQYHFWLVFAPYLALLLAIIELVYWKNLA